MSQNIGEMTLEIILKFLDAENGAKRVTASFKNVDDVTKQVTKSTTDLSGKLAKTGLALNAVREAGNILASSLSTIFNTIRNSNDAYQNFLSSTRQLQAASKLTGANLDTLNKISGKTKDLFSLSSGQANIFTIELTKLGQKAGDVSKVEQSINALMDLGAGQGLNAEQTLLAIKQAILGIDEGTDKLFQKNPSVLYAEFAAKIGTTAGKLTDQQKAQALLNAVLDSGGKLTGSYSDYLNSAAGKQQILNTKILDAKIKLGEQLQPVMMTFLNTANNILSIFSSLSPSMQKWVIVIGTMGITVGKLIPLLITFKDTFGGLNTSISKLGNDAPGAFGKVEKAGISAFGKGSLLVAALLATIGLIGDIFDNIDRLKRERRELLDRPTPPPNVPPGYKSENGVLVPETTTPMDWGFVKKRFLEEQKAEEERKKLQEGTKKTTEDNTKANNELSKSVGRTSRGYSDAGTTASVFTSYLKELEDQLADIQTRISSQTLGESFFSGLFGTEAELKKKIAQIKDLNELGEAGFITKRSREELADLKLPEKKFGAPILSDKAPEDTATTVGEEFNDTLGKGVEQGISLAQQLSSVLGIGADTFAGQLISGLQEGLSLANSIAGFLTTVFNIGSGGGGGIFSLLGFASGGSVPGSGSGDSVPAMLTPGEFVINKSRASQLGTGFLTWLNGGGLFSSMAGHYASGGMVAAAGSGAVQVVVLDSKIKGNDIVLSQARTEKTNKRRMI